MFILRDLLRPLQAHFSDTELGRERSSLFAYTLLVVIVSFTSSMTSNLLRSLVTLFGIDIKKKRFYTFMASSTLLWQKLWPTVWGLITCPETEGRLLVVLNDYINPKRGTHISKKPPKVSIDIIPVIRKVITRFYNFTGEQNRCSGIGMEPGLTAIK